MNLKLYTKKMSNDECDELLMKSRVYDESLRYRKLW